MKNVIKVINAILATVAMSLAVNASADAAVHFHTLKSTGFMSQASNAVSEIISVRAKKSDDSFFSAMDPTCSKSGAVKTYTIKAVTVKKSKDSFNIKGRIENESSEGVVRFLNRPINGVLTSSYGTRIHPKRRTRHFHSGIDLAAKSGTPIACAGSGKVVFAGWKSGYGYCIMVDHGNGIETLYGHCSKLLASTGQSVAAGKIIGKVGRTGVATGPHLHFEVRKNGAYQNPFRYFKN